MANAEFDYIVVGSGAGGAPLAARLARMDRVYLGKLLRKHGLK